MKKESFCNKDCELAVAIPQLLLNHIFGESLKGEIENRYNDMRNNFDLNYDEWQDRFTTKGRPFRGFDDTTAICIPSEKTYFPELQEFNRIGLDLPTWSNVNYDKPIVMFIAQDPLRSDCYEDCHDIVVSSPFGVQDTTHRNSRHGIVYFSIFSEIVKKGFGIYLTDANKFFVKGEKSVPFTKENIERYNQILQEEIRIVNPVKIITFGLDAQRSVMKIVDDKMVLPLIHPSGTARGHIKKNYNIEDCSNKNIVKIYVEEILSSLSILQINNPV